MREIGCDETINSGEKTGQAQATCADRWERSPEACFWHKAFLFNKNYSMAKYSKGAQDKVEKAMHERKEGTLKSGRSGKKVTSRKQAIAIGLSEARAEGKKVPKKKSAPRKSASRRSASRAK